MSEQRFTPLGILRAARDKIKAGWCQGAYFQDTNAADLDYEEYIGDIEVGAFCALGAIYGSVLDHADDEGCVEIDGIVYSKYSVEAMVPAGVQDAVHAVRDCARESSAHYCDIPEWNDEDGRTKEEVLAAFDCAISGLEAA